MKNVFHRLSSELYMAEERISKLKARLSKVKCKQEKSIQTWHQHLCMSAQSFSCVQLFVTPLTQPAKAPLSMGFFRQEYWSGFPCLPPGYHPNPGIKPTSPESLALQVDSLLLSHWGNPASTSTSTSLLIKLTK